MVIAILFVSFIYSIFLNVLYLSKRHIKTYETKMYSIMMIGNLIGILLEFGCIISIHYLGISNLLTIIVNKIFLVYLLTFAILFSLYAAYMVLINGKEEDLSKKHNIIRYTALGIELIFAILIVILRVDLHSNGWTIYSSGPAVDIVYPVSTLCTSFCVGMMIFKYKHIKSKKTLILLLTYIIGCGTVALIQQMNPALTLATSMETLIIFLMYHTIENPDVKMIEQLNLAKEQADKANRA